MSSIPNTFNGYVEEDTTNHHLGFVQMNNNSSVIRSMFLPTNDQTNLFSSFASYENSLVTSSPLSSFGFSGSQMRRRNFDSDIVSVSNLTPLRDNPLLTQISFTKTTTKRYSALVPTNTISSFQNDFQHVQRDNLVSRTNLWNPRFQSQTSLDTNSEILNTNPLSVVYPHQESAFMFSPPPTRNPYQYGSSMKSPEPQIQPPPLFPDTNLDEILSPEPLNFDYPHRESAYPHHSGMFTSAPSRNPYQYGSPMKTPEAVPIQPPTFPDTNTDEIFSPEPLRVVYPNRKSAYRYHSNMFSSSPNPNQDQAVGPEPTRFSEVTAEKDETYDGRTHSLPCKKLGPYKCPKCDGVFDISQTFAAHMLSHYKNETKKEREERLRARNKNKFRKLCQGIRYAPPKKKIKVENGESSGANDVRSVSVAFNYPVAVKIEQV